MVQNELNIQEQAQAAATGLVNLLTAITPLFLVIVIVGIATFNGWLEYVYYSAVIGSLAWIPGFLFAFMRFGSGLGGIKLFKTGYVMKGLFFLAVSIGLTFWTASHVPKMGESLAVVPNMAEHATWLFRTLLWTALIGEVMIAIYMSTHNEMAATSTSNDEPETAQRNGATWYATAQRNGSETAQRNGATSGNGTYNAAPQQAQQEQDETFFRGGLRRAQQKTATRQSAVSSGVSDDAYLLQEDLDKARNNLRAYQSKLRNKKGNPETLQKGVARWEKRVAQLESQLQEI